MIKPVIIWQSMQHAYDNKSDDEIQTLVIFNYGREYEFTKIYLMDRKQAEELFTEDLNNRSDMEIQDEGWNANAVEINLINNEAAVGNWSPQFKRISDLLFSNMMKGS